MISEASLPTAAAEEHACARGNIFVARARERERKRAAGVPSSFLHDTSERGKIFVNFIAPS